MRLFIHYDGKGSIVSATKSNLLDESLAHPYGLIGEDEGVLEVETDAELEALDCHEICERYKVDLKKKSLRKRPARRPRPR